jgi:Arc/MetJ family transcription regulator
MRTNIYIDDSLIRDAMNISGSKTKKEVVELALSEFVRRRTQKNLAELRGKIRFADDYDYKKARSGEK